MDRDHELEEIMGLKTIPRKNIFEEFLHFMLRKSFEEVVNENEENLFAKENKMNDVVESSRNIPPSDEEYEHLGPKIKRKSAATLKEREKQKGN